MSRGSEPEDIFSVLAKECRIERMWGGQILATICLDYARTNGITPRFREKCGGADWRTLKRHRWRIYAATWRNLGLTCEQRRNGRSWFRAHLAALDIHDRYGGPAEQ